MKNCYRFWIISNRGTDKEIYKLLDEYDDVEYECEEWIRINFPQCHEYRWGYEKVDHPPTKA